MSECFKNLNNFKRLQAQFMARNVLVQNPPTKVEINEMNEKFEEAKKKMVGFGEPVEVDGAYSGYIGAYLAQPSASSIKPVREVQKNSFVAQSVSFRHSPDFCAQNVHNEEKLMNSLCSPDAAASGSFALSSSSSSSLPNASSFQKVKIVE